LALNPSAVLPYPPAELPLPHASWFWLVLCEHTPLVALVPPVVALA